MKQNDTKQLKLDRKNWLRDEHWFSRLLVFLLIERVWFTWAVHPNTSLPQYHLLSIRHERYNLWNPLFWVLILIAWVAWSLSFWVDKDDGFRDIIKGWN